VSEQLNETGADTQQVAWFELHKGVKWGILLGILLALGVGATSIWSYYVVRVSTDDAQIDGYITPVSARVSGTVQSVNFLDNQLVKTGDLLVQFEPKDYQVAIDKVTAELKDAQASAAAAQKGVSVSNQSAPAQLAAMQAQLAAVERDAEAAGARIREAEANHIRASQDLQRMKQLIGKDEISQQQYDAAVATEAASRANLDAARASGISTQNRVHVAMANVKNVQMVPEVVAISRDRSSSASAVAQKTSAALEQAQLNLQYTQIRAVGNGIIGKRSVQPGQVVNAGQPLASLVDLDTLFVTANFKEDQLRKMHPGQRATIKVDAYGIVMNGRVDSIGGATGARYSLLPPENATGNYVKVVQRIPVKIIIDPGQDPQHRLRPGMSVIPTVYTGK
jgi:membrane fusion protein, multidrug efflux system